MLVTQKDGALRISSGGSAATLVTIPTCTAQGMGVLGVIVDPDFATNRFIYVHRAAAGPGGCTTSAGRTTQIARLTMAPDDSIDLGTLTVIVGGMRTDTGDHHGGDLHVGPDGKLYLATGDSAVGDNQGCPGSSTNPYAQDLDALEGKVLRVNLDGTAPADNPFFGQGATREKVWARGFRNPFRFTFDPLAGRLWLADVGDIGFEELNIVVPGGNYGWPHCEGVDPPGCEQPGDVPPIFAYAHGSACPDQNPPFLGRSIIGGAFAGNGFGAYRGDYVFGDYTQGAIYRAIPNAARDDVFGTPEPIVTAAGGPVHLSFGPDGALYYVSIFFGQVRRVATTPTAADQEVTGRKLLLRAHLTKQARKKLSAKSRDATITLGGGEGSADDPTVAGGAVRLRADDFDVTYPLAPGGGWRYVGNTGTVLGYRYRSPAGTNSPIRSATVRAGRFVGVKGAGAALGFGLATDPGPVDVIVRIGTQHYCMRFGGLRTFKPGRLASKDAAPPAACPP
jgi:glucose/arabinose dehydrogenase